MHNKSLLYYVVTGKWWHRCNGCKRAYLPAWLNFYRFVMKPVKINLFSGSRTNPLTSLDAIIIPDSGKICRNIIIYICTLILIIIKYSVVINEPTCLGCQWSSSGIVRAPAIKLQRVDEYRYGGMKTGEIFWIDRFHFLYYEPFFNMKNC
jgi:hypothetical protein